ncbi:MAG: family 10 glycosylhydrolase [Prevotella sp.]|nr:family 10 glycosylhydrolase [Prevotella sp.]MCM1074745.1 family 10 glycosylhydrolase [Ruminococcus sp.]
MKTLKTLIFAIILSITGALSAAALENAPKREFRGAWIQVIGQSQWMNKTPEQQRAYFTEILDKLNEAGCNALIFQIRPTADALYESEIEPWSKWLTGKRGKAPAEKWDPLAFAISEAHKRGMELHAWLNPYRVTSDAKEVLPPEHLYNQHKERFFRFDNKIFFDPAYQENRDYISTVIADIVSRYDIDAIHLDDYFYPYPAANGTRFDGDGASYAKFGKGKNKADWRRENVDKLIEQLHRTIKDIKPWVQFGISPFGIWRNKSSDPRGSESGGLQNYDDLYADVILWAKNGWIDYLVPQLYWPLDKKVAPSRKLAKWWNDNVPANCKLYIGQNTQGTMDTPTASDSNELSAKIDLSRRLDNVHGNAWYHGYWVVNNYKGVNDKLASEHQRTLALPPLYTDKPGKPAKVYGLRTEKTNDGMVVAWDLPENFHGYGAEATLNEAREDDVVKFVVYEFFKGESIDMNDPEAIIAITPISAVKLDSAEPGTTFIVTALDRMGRESDASAKLIVK